jgi:exonuclease V
VKLEYPADAQTQVLQAEETDKAPPGADDTEARSPYERYRSRKKALSVTDLVSAVWCEQQFEYTLQQGFKTRTPQMQKGTEVHRKLEEQVHTVVEVRQAKTKEDRWGLKLFNMYQGLCGFEETGLTRELPVFGFMDDIFVQGVIDEITYVNPESRLAAMTSQTTAKGDPRKRPKFEPENDILLENSRYKLDIIPPAGERTAYISDTKTRASKTAPSASQTRQTSLQLMLYRDLLLNMRDKNFDFAKFLDWFELDGNSKFSDGFIVEMADIGDTHTLEFFVENNSLWNLWTLIQGKLAEAMDNIGAPMGVAYRAQTDGALIRFQVMQFDSAQLEKHLKTTMGWWKGTRNTVGVEIEEAWKCKPRNQSSGGYPSDRLRRSKL